MVPFEKTLLFASENSPPAPHYVHDGKGVAEWLLEPDNAEFREALAK